VRPSGSRRHILIGAATPQAVRFWRRRAVNFDPNQLIGEAPIVALMSWPSALQSSTVEVRTGLKPVSHRVALR
jgi:hypothetical protein